MAFIFNWKLTNAIKHQKICIIGIFGEFIKQSYIHYRENIPNSVNKMITPWEKYHGCNRLISIFLMTTQKGLNIKWKSLLLLVKKISYNTYFQRADKAQQKKNKSKSWQKSCHREILHHQWSMNWASRKKEVLENSLGWQDFPKS